MGTLEILKNAKQIMLNRGRCTGELVNPSGQVCLLGAIGVAVYPEDKVKPTDVDYDTLFGEGTAAEPAVLELIKYLPDLVVYEDDYDAVIGFNDSSLHTDDEVYALFDEAIAGLEVAA